MRAKDAAHLIFIIFLILTVSCNNDHSGRDHITRQQSWEEKYLEDYEAPQKKWGFIDVTGAWRIDPGYDAALDFSEGLAAVNKNGYWGYVDTNGIEVIPPRYLDAWSFQNGTARVLTVQRTYLFIDKLGQAINQEHFDDAVDMAVAGTFVKKTNSWGIMSPSGRMVTSFLYDEPGVFVKGYAFVKYNNQWLLIDSVGTIHKRGMRVETEYSEDGFWLISFGDSSFFYSPQKGLSIPLGTIQVEAHMFPRILATTKDGTYEVLRADSSLWTKWPKRNWTSCYISYPGIWTCRNTEQTYHLVSDEGTILSDRYINIYPFEDGLAIFESNKTFGYLDTKGQVIIPNQFLLAWPYRNGLARTIRTDGKLYFIDKKGVIQLKSPGYEARDFSNGLSRCQE